MFFFNHISKSNRIICRLLLRRGADPTFSDWPLPVLALAVRSNDEQMVKLLLKKKAQVNCQLNLNRHANLTPLHIACGCLMSNPVEIIRLLLEHHADVNAQSPSGNKEYLSLIDPLIVESNRIVCFVFSRKRKDFRFVLEFE